MPACTPVGGTCVYTCVLPRGVASLCTTSLPIRLLKVTTGWVLVGIRGGMWVYALVTFRYTVYMVWYICYNLCHIYYMHICYYLYIYIICIYAIICTFRLPYTISCASSITSRGLSFASIASFGSPTRYSVVVVVG